MSEEITFFWKMNHIYFPLQTLGTIASFVGVFRLRLFFFLVVFLVEFQVFLHNKCWFIFIVAGGYLSVCNMILERLHLPSCKIENKSLQNL